MKKLKTVLLLMVMALLLGSLMGCGSKESNEDEVAADESIVDSAKQAIGDAAEGAQSALDKAGDTAQNTAEQVGEVIGAVGTIVVDQGGAIVDVVGEAGQTTAEMLENRISSLKPDENGNFSVSIHENEINQLIKIQELLTGPIPGNPFRNTKVTFKEGVIIFTADVFEPFIGDLIVKFGSFVDEEQVRFQIVDASLGDKEAPQKVLDAAADTLDNTLGKALGFLPDNLKPREIIIADGAFTLNGGGIAEGQ